MAAMLRRRDLLITTTDMKQGMSCPQLTSIRTILFLPPPRRFIYIQFPAFAVNQWKQCSRRRPHHHHRDHQHNHQLNLKLISVYLRASLTERPIIKPTQTQIHKN
jgi:hypothetical protein